MNLEQSNNLMISIWYGEKRTIQDIDSLKMALTKVTTEKECILLINELFKLGDFSAKGLLIQLLNTAQEENVLNLCIRLFCSVVTHDDLLKNENFLFLSNVSDDNANTFASCAPDTLSYEVIPYLLALLEEWEDIYVEQTIRDSLDIMLGYYKVLGENVSVDEIGQFYLNHLKEINPKKYYYRQELVFPGNLAKRLIEKAILTVKTNSSIEMEIIPCLLSVWSGKKCPVEYDTVITDEKVKEVFSYVDSLSRMDWKKGSKYFYSYLIDE